MVSISSWSFGMHTYPLASIPYEVSACSGGHAMHVETHLVQDRLQVGTREVDRGGVSGRSGSNDDHLRVLLLGLGSVSLGLGHADSVDSVGDGRHGGVCVG